MLELQLAQTCQASDSLTCDLVYRWTGNEQLSHGATWLIGRPLSILGLIVIGIVVRWIAHRVIDRVVHRTIEGVRPGKATGKGTAGSARRAQRARAMGSLLQNIVTCVVVAVVAIMAIGELGYNVAPLIASAGILGLALGFGAQSLVKDFLAGIFMIFEDQYGVGDVVDLGEASGTIEAVGMRITRLRDVDGTVWYVRNGEILRVGNMSQNWARTVLDINVGYGEDLQRVRRVLANVAHELWEDTDFREQIIEEPEVWGVQSMNPESVTVRVTLKTAPMEQWTVAREMRERIIARFEREHIRFPLPQRVVTTMTTADHPGAGDPAPGE